MDKKQKTLFLETMRLFAAANMSAPPQKKTPTTPRKGPTSAPSGENVRVLRARTA